MTYVSESLTDKEYYKAVSAVGDTETVNHAKFKYKFLILFISADPDEDSMLDSGTKTEPQSPTSCCQSIFENLELEQEDINIRVDFPDLKHLYHKTQSRVNRQSRQRVVKGKIKVRVTTRGHQVQAIEVYVERTPDAAHLVGDKCGRVYLKPQPGPYFPNKVKEKRN